MVQYVYPDDLPGGGEAFGGYYVFGTGLHVAAGVVVRQDYSRGLLADCFGEDFAETDDIIDDLFVQRVYAHQKIHVRKRANKSLYRLQALVFRYGSYVVFLNHLKSTT